LPRPTSKYTPTTNRSRLWSTRNRLAWLRVEVCALSALCALRAKEGTGPAISSRVGTRFGELCAERDDFALQLSKSVPQRLKPSSKHVFAARLKPCPDTKPSFSERPPFVQSFFGSLLKLCRPRTAFLGDEYDGRSPRPEGPKLGNLEPPIRSKGLNGKEETLNNDDSSAEP